MVGLIWFLVIAAVLVGFCAVAVKAYGSRLPGVAPEALPGLACTLFTLKMGDIVQFDARDWVVEGVLTYDEDGFQWLEYLLQDQTDIRWLSVEEDDRVETLWMLPYSGLDVSHPGAKQLNIGGHAYQLQESGTATMTRRGNTLNRQAETCRYFEYRSESADVNQQHLSVEDWDGDIEVTVGYAVQPQDLRLLPGDGERVYNARS